MVAGSFRTMDDLHIRSVAWQAGVRRKRPVLPWEVFPLQSVLGDPQAKRAKGSIEMLGKASQGDGSPKIVLGIAKKTAISRRGPGLKVPRKSWLKRTAASSAWSDKLDQDRSCALEIWKVIIMASGDATGLGRTLLDLQDDDADEEVMAQTIKDVFANKSTATLRGRSGSLAMFGRWLAARRAVDSVPIFPISERGRL